MSFLPGDIPSPVDDLDRGIADDEEWLQEQPRTRFKIEERWESNGYMGGYTKEEWLDDPSGDYVASKSSRNGVEVHFPVFDVDNNLFHIRESASPGHHHVFFDNPVTWSQYKKLLKAMSAAGMVDPRWVKMTLRRKNGVLRIKWPFDYYEKKQAREYAEWQMREGLVISWY